MADTPNENLDEDPKNLKAENVFAGDLNLTPSTEDIFAGGKELEMALQGQAPGGVLPDHSVTYQVQGSSGKKLSLTHIMLTVLTIAVGGLIFRPAPKTLVQLPPDFLNPGAYLEPNNIDQQQDDVAKSEPESDPFIETVQAVDGEFYFDSPLSWKMAHTLFTEKQYGKAYFVYEKLSQNLAIDDSQRDMLKDVLNLQMALCLFLDGRSDDLSSLLTVVLDSRSPAIRALANYYIGFIDFRGKQYLSARSRAYRAIATMEIIKDDFPESMEADCYFLMANSITCEIIRLSNRDFKFPGKFWSDTLVPYFLPEMNAQELSVFLNKGVEILNAAVLEPIIESRKGITVGSKYSAIANKSAVDEVIAKFASISEYEVNWSQMSQPHRRFPVTMVLSKTSSQEIPELALGSLGLIARFDTSEISVYDPKSQSSLDKQKKLLTEETITVWQRFLLRYRGDHRSANAHFSLALMRELSEMHDVALGEYKIILSRYSTNSLAPFALLNSSKIKTNLMDYPAARKYLKQLVLEYPNAKIADDAYLYLAKANMSIELYDEAFSLFKKVYYVNLTDAAKSDAAYGAALSKFHLKDYKSSEEWFGKCFEVLTDPPSIDVYKAYYFMAKTKMELGKYSEAVTAYKYALSGNLTKEEFSRVIIEITETLVEKGDLTEALNLIENAPEFSLPPQQQCEVLIAKSRIYKAMNLPGNGISILKQKIEYMADFQLRSMLMLELGRCYIAAGELEKAYNEIAAAITEMPVGDLLLVANTEFAEVCTDLGRYQQTVEICLGVLNTPIPKNIKYRTCGILGRAYQHQKKYAKAAEAFAGIYDKYEVSKNE